MNIKELDEQELDQVSGGLLYPIPMPPIKLPKWPCPIPIPRLPIYKI